MNSPSVAVSAGVGGFLAFFFLAMALYFLMRNMNARLRRMAYREEQQAAAGDDSDALDGPETSGPEGDPKVG
jgi:hypothetical protein